MKRANFASDIVYLLSIYEPKPDSIYLKTNYEKEPSPRFLYLKIEEEIDCVPTLFEKKNQSRNLIIDLMDQVYPIKNLNSESEIPCYSKTGYQPLKDKIVEKSSKDISK